MKYFLLMAGDNYYPQADTSDWINSFETYEEALSKVTVVNNYRTITKGPRKGEQELINISYIINGIKYDWYDIIDLREWITK